LTNFDDILEGWMCDYQQMITFGGDLHHDADQEFCKGIAATL